MSYMYDAYLREHIANVQRGWDWLNSHFPDLHNRMSGYDIWIFDKHDASKYSDDEYAAYDKYFYGNNRSYKIVKDFNYAWLHHIHNNPHHWQYWILVNDKKEEEILDMPYWYIVEMICDWWSFSWKTGKLDEIFEWYDKHKNMKLSDKTRKEVEKLLDMIRKGLEEDGALQHSEEYLMHHGREGQKWGVKNGPPYPLDRKTVEKAYKQREEEAAGKERMKVLHHPQGDLAKKDLIDGDPHPVEKFEDLKKLPENVDMNDIRKGINHPGKKGEDDLGRSYNCPKCACAFEMTERGYDVQARPAKNGSNVGDIEKYFKGGKLGLFDAGDSIDKVEKAASDYFKASVEERKAKYYKLYDDALKDGYMKFDNELKKQGDGSRGIIVVGWIMDEMDLSKRTTCYHAINYKVEDGTVSYYDPQSYKMSTGTKDVNDVMYGSDPRELYSMRTDNLEVNPSIAEMVYSRGGKAA